MRLKEWIESHPQSSFDIMTPGGYVFLTPERAKELLEGKDMNAHPGISGYDIMISAEELLAQNVVNVNWDGEVCHMLTDYIQKREPEPPAPGQGVVMC